MNTFITRKRPASTIETNDDVLPTSAPLFSPQEPSSAPAKKARITSSTVESSAAKTPRTKKASGKGKAVEELGHCSLNKKEFGDKIKSCLALEKYPMKMDVVFFKSFFGDKGIPIEPADYDVDTPVVVVELGNKEAGELFGVTKIKNGNRYETVQLRRMCVILYPKKEIATAWISV